MLLAKCRSEPILRAGHEQECCRQQHDRNEQGDVGRWNEGKEYIQPGCDGAEQSHQSTVSDPKGIPQVADESENEGEVEGDAGDESEIRRLVCFQVKLVLQKKADRDIYQTSGG